MGYDYRIGIHEVTNVQYAAFLNTVGQSSADAALVYSTSSIILRTGADGNYAYSVQNGWDNKPAAVSLFQAMRFINWLENGQGGPETIQNGTYTLLGNDAVPSNVGSITRNSDSMWWLPNEDEWYKAAYGIPGSDAYFLFPTSSDLTPVAESPPGGTNSANYATLIDGSYTDVGAYLDSASPFGTFDQGGNIQEWLEDSTNSGLMRGGDTIDDASYLASTRRYFNVPVNQSGGFRVAVASVPEPNSLTLAVLGCTITLAIALRRRNRVVVTDGVPHGE
ncbi:MAG: SUMF1/EgtB/PvdO family nonheme iron enzyme [Pirellulales bacterium]|nr:SUMF1/EgtB/PvdO family nonheme iron enzyme [Pirellulales bacterium]